MLELIATDLAKSRSSFGAVTALMDSLFVRTTSPSRSGEPRERAAVPAVGEQLVGAEGAGGHHDPARGQGPGVLAASQAPERALATA